MMYVASQIALGRKGWSPTSQSNRLYSYFIRWVISLFLCGVAVSHAADLDLSWTDNSSDETGFKIERSTDGTNFSQITTVGANVTNYTDTSLSDSTQYWYRVRAYNGAGDSGYTNIANATTTASNSLPTISDIGNQTIDQDTSTGALNFTIDDAETAVGSLTLSGSSSNTTLIPNGNIVFGGSGANRTVTVTPQAGETGSATITVTVDDGTDNASDTFVVTVNSVGGNSLPTISDIGNQTIDQDTNTGALNFTIGDLETAAGSLTLSGSSSSTTLVPNGNIVFGGSGASRTVTVTPQAGETGAATITVTVNDGTDSVSDTFLLTVNSVGGNNTPTISNIGNQTIDEDTNTGAINFTVGDIETAAGSLIVSGSSSNTSLVPNANIVFGGSGANRTVTITPLPDADGSATITITVDDGTDTSFDTFSLSVTDTDPPPSGGGGSGGGGGGSGGGGTPIENRVPTITEISDYTIFQDENTGGIGFTIWDAETASKDLVLTAISSNLVLVPEENMVFSGISSNRKITVTPAPGESGTATITISVSDGEDSVSEEFILTVSKEPFAPTIAVQPIDVSTLEGEQTIFTVVASGYPEPDYQWRKNGVDIVGATSSNYIIETTLAEDEGFYSVVVSNSEGSVTSSSAELLVNTLVILQQPVSVNILEDGSVTLSVEALGENLSYQWYQGETGDTSSPIEGATDSTYTTQPLTESTSFWVQVSSDNGQVLSVDNVLNSDSAVVSVGEQIELLSNMSIRAEILPGTNSLIAGFVVNGEGNKRILIRGVGPSIADPNIQQRLEDPFITLFALNEFGQFEVVAQNDDWSDTEDIELVESSTAQVGAFALPRGSKDAALVLDLPAGNYGAQISGVSGALGTALVEIYDVDSTIYSIPTTVLSNISTRGQIGQGNNVVIAGFVVNGTEPKRFLIRAVGPELADQGVTNFLDDPEIHLYHNGVPVTSNNNWNHFTDTIADASSSVGAFQLTPKSKSSAIVVWLEPGIYGAVALSASGSTGEALVEVYEAP